MVMELLNWISKTENSGTAVFLLLLALIWSIERIFVSWARAFAVAKEAKYGVVRAVSHHEDDDEDDDDEFVDSLFEDDSEVLEQTHFHRAIDSVMAYMLKKYPGQEFLVHLPAMQMVESYVFDLVLAGEDQTAIRLVVSEDEHGEYEVEQAPTEKVA